MRTKNKTASVTLRYKKLKDRFSLYLDKYTHDERHFEYLSLYTSKDYSKVKNVLAKDQETVELAKSICAKREIEIKASDLGIRVVDREGTCFIEFLEKQAKAKPKQEVYLTLIKHFRHYIGKAHFPFRECTYEFFSGFFQSLEVSNNTMRLYMQTFRAAWNEAVKQDITTRNPLAKLTPPKATKSQRVCLTQEELAKMIDCNFTWNQEIRQAFLFSCFTGLRFSDLQKLTWQEIDRGANRIRLKMQKTGDFLEIPLHLEAQEILNSLSSLRPLVFPNLPSSQYCNRTLNLWASYSGVAKTVTFHVARHTFVYFNQSQNIYRIAALLGHQDVQTTQKYMHLLDSDLQSAIDKMPRFDLRQGKDKN